MYPLNKKFFFCVVLGRFVPKDPGKESRVLSHPDPPWDLKSNKIFSGLIKNVSSFTSFGTRST